MQEFSAGDGFHLLEIKADDPTLVAAKAQHVRTFHGNLAPAARGSAEVHDPCTFGEELEPVIKTTMQSMGLQVEGKELFPRIDEFSPEIVRQGFEKTGLLEEDENREEWESWQRRRTPCKLPRFRE